MQPNPSILSESADLTDAEVAAIAARAETWRKAHGLNHNAFIARFKPYVIDTKGWHLIRNVAYSQWGKGRDLVRSGVRGLLAALTDEDKANKVPCLIETAHTLRFEKALKLLREQRDIRRCILLLGPTSSGKSSTLNLAQATMLEGRKVVRIRGREAWRSPNEMLNDWGEALGLADLKGTVAAKQTKVHDALLDLSDALVFIDEGHRLTGAEINMLIDWINDMADAGNAVHFVLAAVETLWRKLSEEAREEADQLRINRCLDEIILAPPDAEECNLLLNIGCRAEAIFGKFYQDFLIEVVEKAATAGSRAFVRDVRALIAGKESLTPTQGRGILAAVAAKNHARARNRRI